MSQGGLSATQPAHRLAERKPPTAEVKFSAYSRKAIGWNKNYSKRVAPRQANVAKRNEGA